MANLIIEMFNFNDFLCPHIDPFEVTSDFLSESLMELRNKSYFDFIFMRFYKACK